MIRLIDLAAACCPGERPELFGGGGIQEDGIGGPHNVWESSNTSEVCTQCRHPAPEKPRCCIRSTGKMLSGLTVECLDGII